jgi:outer membrane protein assembly factor BamD
LKSKAVIIIVGAVISMVYFLGCGSPGIKTAPTAQGQFALAKKEYDKKHYLSAIEGFRKVIFNFPGATMVDTAQFYLAMAYYENEDYELASVEFNRLASNYPKSSYVDDGEYLAGVCYFKNTPENYALDQDELKKAITIMEDFIAENPDSPLVTDAKQIILAARSRLARKEYENGALYFKVADYRAAEIYFQLVIDEYTDTEYAAKALFKLAESSFKLKDYTKASDRFNNFISVYSGNEMIPDANEYLKKIEHKQKMDNASGAAK